MTAWPKQDAASMNAFFGDPDADHNGVPDRAWEDANLTLVTPPYRMVLAWALDKPVRGIRCHKKVATSLAVVLKRILDHYGNQPAVEAAGMHLYGGAYNFRLKRGGATLSNHSWGSAIDLDPAHNGFGVRNGSMPAPVVKFFEAEGWVWGGHWSTPDAMHFQAARL